MRVTILGCRSGMPANGQPSSGYLVATSDAAILLDCGPGIATALGAVAAPGELSAVIVSHLHLDHCYDLLPLGKSLLARALRYPRAGEVPQTWTDIDAVPLHVPAGSAAVLGQLAAGAKAPVLTHFPSAEPDWLLPRRDEAAREFAGVIHLARPGATFQIGRALP